jgi:hypothetical protein
MVNCQWLIVNYPLFTITIYYYYYYLLFTIHCLCRPFRADFPATLNHYSLFTANVAHRCSLTLLIDAP